MNQKIFIIPVLLVSLIFLLESCNTSNENIAHDNWVNSPEYKEGLNVVSLNCITCHKAQEDHEDQIAPPLAAVKAHYYKEGMEEDAFVEKMTAFLMNPDITKSEMPKAIEKFGIMPNPGFTKEQYDAVARYIFHAELEKPEWFEEHFTKEQAAIFENSDGGNVDYLKKGMTLALSTKAVLGKNLLTSIKERGTEGALSFCNEKAFPLTDSMANHLKAGIKRVSDNNRNPDNAANADELAYIVQAKKEITENGQANPKLIEHENMMVGYYPIMTNQMCLQCHGAPSSDITSNSLAAIKQLYPADKATGYGENELRGIWVIEMPKK